MTTEEDAIQFANDRPMSLDDNLYQWAVDADELIREQAREIQSHKARHNLGVQLMQSAQQEIKKQAQEIERLRKTLETQQLEIRCECKNCMCAHAALKETK